MDTAASKPFRELCAEHGIAVTHQRQVLYEVMRGMTGTLARKRFTRG